MALLQISEPGQTPNPHQRRIAVGIDLGTTHSLVAAMRHGLPECLPDEAGRVILPSVVRYLDDGRRQIGHDALAAQTQDPHNTIASVKRLMGRSLHDVQQHSHSSVLHLVDGRAAQPQPDAADSRQPPHHSPAAPAEPAASGTAAAHAGAEVGAGMVRIRTRAGDKSPVEVSAEILATLRYRAEDTFADDLYGAVITVPAYFDDAQRQATKDAAQLAGIHVLRLVNEPTAAAIAYGLDNAAEGTYAVFDLGGGTFDISILRLSAGVFEVIATGGDSSLGGDDYDAALLHWLQQHKAIPQAASTSQQAALLHAARAAKHALTTQPDTLFAPVEDSLQAATCTVTRADLQAATQALTQRCLAAVRSTLHDARLHTADVQGIVMVGGSTRMPLVQQAVADLFGRPPLTNLNPDEVVALGAAIQANQLAGNNPDGDLLLLDVIPLSLGIETMGGLVERIIPRNQTIPTAMAQDFTTYQDGQTAMSLHVVQGERDMVADCRSLARFTLRGIPPMTAGAARIRVTFTVDADGLLHVSAQEQTSGVEASIDVKPSYGLGDDDIARMLQDSFATAEADKQARALAEARLDAQRLLLATGQALQADADLLSADEQAHIQQLITTLHTCADTSSSPAEIEAATKALAHGTEDFAARRMNRSIAQALAGRSIDAV